MLFVCYQLNIPSYCNSYFRSSNRRPLKLQKLIFSEYIYKRQTLSDLAAKYHKNISWIQKQIFVYEPIYKIHNPRAVNLICDAIFHGKRRDKLGTLVFKDSITKEILIWKHNCNQNETHLLSTYFNMLE